MIDLGFGDPVLIRQQLKSIYTLHSGEIGYRMDDQCEVDIIKWVKWYYKDKFGIDYKHVILTHGANGGLHMLINALKGAYSCFFTHDMAFSWYDRLLKMEDSYSVKVADLRTEEGYFNSIYIVDSPSNPWGYQVLNDKLNEDGVIWDSVYASSIFINPAIMTAPKHKFMVGSLSKMFGMSGLRVGWVATQDDFWARKLKDLALTAYCGLSTPSLEIASNIVNNVDVDSFNKIAKLNIDFNREEFNKIRNIFNMEAPDSGMFYLGALDDKNTEILQKAKVSGINLTSIKGVKYIRLNMADDWGKTKSAIKSILKADAI